jgi:hypothetical protein
MSRKPGRSFRLTLLGLGVAALAVAGFATAYQRRAQTFLPSGWALAPAGLPTRVGDMLAGGTASPNGKWIAFVSVGQGVHQAYLVDRATGTLRDTIAIDRGWIGVDWSRDSSTLYVSGGPRPASCGSA